MSNKSIINTLADEQHLLSAVFEINGRVCQVMVDTGATISCIPEHGEIMKHARNRVEKTNLTVQLANNATETIDKKIKAHMRPAGSKTPPSQVQFYIHPNMKDIFGFQALLGLNCLKNFDLQIETRDNTIYIYHENKLIGNESPALASINSAVKVINKGNQSQIENNVELLLDRYKEVFGELDARPIKGSLMRILTVHPRPIFSKQRHYSIDEIKEMKIHVNKLLEQGVIEPSKSGYAANSRIIRKKNGQGRLVINYIPLNAVTHRDSYALPHVMDILGAIQGKQYFSSMDCTQGFYQIDVDPRDRHKTAFSTPLGNFQFRRCPFGARNSCAEFQAAMNRIFQEGLFTRCVIYVDDILVFGETKEEHNRNLEWVLEQCQKYDVKLKMEKCKFLQQEVEYLGFLVSGTSIKPIADKVSKLQKLEAPKNKTELRSIIGKLNFYARFIPSYSKSLESLRGLMLKHRDFQWRETHQLAYEKMISQLDQVNTHALVTLDRQKKILLVVLHDSIEAILVAEDNELINRTSRLLSTSESNYSFIEKQLLALIMALNKFRILMQPNRFVIKVPSNDLDKIIKQVHRPARIDNLLLKIPPEFDELYFELDESLPSNTTKKKPFHVAEEIFYIDGACKNNGKENCRASWAICAEYDKHIESRGFVDKDPSNQTAELTAAIEACKLAKALGLKAITIVTDSKYLYSAATLWMEKWTSNNWTDHKKKPIINTEKFAQLLEAKSGLDIEWHHVKGHSDNVGNNRADALARGLLDTKVASIYAMTSRPLDIQRDDPEIAKIKREIRNGSHRELVIVDNIVYFIDKKLPEGDQHRVYVPKNATHMLLRLAHDDAVYGGHLGIRKTFRKLARFYWPKMLAEVESYVKSCDTCQKFKNPTGPPAGLLHSIPVSEVFEHIHLDIMGPYTSTFNGNVYVITATDALSKWAFAKPSQRVRTKELIKFVEDEILTIHGMPKRIITDRGTQFTSIEWQEFISKLGIEHKLTSSYHPQANGIDERLNGTLSRILRCYVDANQERWDEHLKWALYVYNTTQHESIGYSPYQVLFGMDSRSPLKPGLPGAETIRPSLTKIRSQIRTDIIHQNKVSQERQKRFYDKHRSPVKLFVGQLVYIKIHAPPTHLSKKFFFKWDGPVVVTGFVGDENNPRAVVILDYDNMKKKVVAINDVKPMINTYKIPENENLKTKEGEGHTLNNSSYSQDKTEPFYYTNDNYSEDHTDNSSYHTPNLTQEATTMRQDPPNIDSFVKRDSDRSENIDELNIASKTLHGPLASSPKRVTISDTVDMRSYLAEEAISSEMRQKQASGPALSNQMEGEITLEATTEQDDSKNEPSNTTSTVYNIDNEHKDPTYIPRTGQAPTESNRLKTTSDPSGQDLTPQNCEPRYNLRSKTREISGISQSRERIKPGTNRAGEKNSSTDSDKSNGNDNNGQSVRDTNNESRNNLQDDLTIGSSRKRKQDMNRPEPNFKRWR